MLLAIAFSFSLGNVPHVELPATFVAGRAFVMPRVASSDRRLALWVDTDGSGFLRSSVVSAFNLQTGGSHTAYLPPLNEPAFPAVRGNRGALPVLDDAQIRTDPVFNGIDGQLGWTWLDGRIWTLDYVGSHLYQDFTAPAIPARDRVLLRFDPKHRYPQLEIGLGGRTYRAALDTAATIALSPGAMRQLHDALPEVRATSFIQQRTLTALHTAHPDWQYVDDAGAPGIAMILVPRVTAANVTFSNVWFSTRPNDDVFQDDPVDAKLGPSAFGNCAVTIDYVHDDAGFTCTGNDGRSP